MLRLKRFGRQSTLLPARPTSRPLASPAWVNLACLSIKRIPVAPVIAWHDGRDHEEVEALRRDITADTFAATTGKPLRGQWAITKHRWLLGHVPSAAHAVRRFNVAEWVVRGLGGDEVTELALACRTGWFDLSRRDWWPEGLAWSGATPAHAALVEAGLPVGQITRSDTTHVCAVRCSSRRS